jgi:hypothetical protein
MDLVKEFSLLYRFITAPIQTVSEDTPSLALALLISALYVLSLYGSSGWGFGPFGYVAFTLLCLSVGLIVGSLIDTLAQLLFHCEPQGLRTSYWLLMAQLPGILGFLLSQIGPILHMPSLLWIAQTSVGFLIVWLQFSILKTLYKISSLRSALLLIAFPLSLLGIVLLLMFTGTTYLMQLG